MLAPVSSISTFAIVAHPDDDLLFMNPDILHSIQSGEGHVSVYLTAGDAGLDEDYWQGREDGIKAAYGEMAGANDWVDTKVTLSNGEEEFTVQSSYLESQPEVRLYFLRLPDGFSVTEAGYVANVDSLEQLWDGAVEDLTTADGANTYTGDDLIGTLHALLEFHQPATIMTQDHETEFSDQSHADHVHGSMFAYEAHELYAENHEHDLVGYVDYQSNDLEPNVSSDDQQAAINAFNAYAQHDSEVHLGIDENGAPNLLERFELWLGRQYHTHEYEQVTEDESFGSDTEGSALDFHVCTFEGDVCVVCDNAEEDTSSEQGDDSISSTVPPPDPVTHHNDTHTVDAEDQTGLGFLGISPSWLGNYQIPAFGEHNHIAGEDDASNPPDQFDSTNSWQPENISNVQLVNPFENIFYTPQSPGPQVEEEQDTWGDIMSQLFVPMQNEHDLAEEAQFVPENQNFLPEFI